MAAVVILVGCVPPHGRVTDRDTGEPIANARVACVARADFSSYFEAISDAAGDFTLSRCGPADEVRVTAADFESAFFDAADLKNGALQVRLTKGPGMSFSGVGLSLRDVDRRIEIAGVLPGGAAARAALRNGMIVTRIDGVAPTDAVSAARLIRGPTGEAVALTVQEKNGAAELTISLVRERLMAAHRD